MAAARYDMLIDQGQTYQLTAVYKTDGVANDLAGCAVSMQIRTAPGATIILDMADIQDGIVITPIDGQIDLHIPDETTATLAAGRYKYDLVLELADGRKYRLLEGNFKVKAGITQDAAP